MGNRANYVLIEAGRHHIYFSRWGALNIPAVLLSGPDATLAYVRGLTPDDTLLDCVWAEGGLVLDTDDQRLCFFGGIEIATTPYLRRPLLAGLRMLWPGWAVGWATHGIADLAHAIGWDVGRVLDTEFDDPALLHGNGPLITEQQVQATRELKKAETLLTVHWSATEIMDYLLTVAQTDALSLGPRLLDIVRRKRIRVPLPSEDGYMPDGIYVNVAAQTVWISGRESVDPRVCDALGRRWLGWQVEGHTAGVARQVILSGRDPTNIMVPDERAINELIEELTQDNTMDPVALLAAIERNTTQPGEQVRVGIGFFSKDAPPLSSSDRRNTLTRLFHDALNR